MAPLFGCGCWNRTNNWSIWNFRDTVSLIRYNLATRGRIELPWSDRQSDVMTIIRTSHNLICVEESNLVWAFECLLHFRVSDFPVLPLHYTQNLVGALRFEQRRSKTRDLQSPPDTVTGLNTQITISFADALFAMTHMLYSSLHLIVIVTQAWSSPWLTSAKLMALCRRIELLLLGWKPSVLTDRRTEYGGSWSRTTTKPIRTCMGNLSQLHASVSTKDLEKISEEQLLYINNVCKTNIIWSGWQDSNLHETDLQSDT